MPVDPDFVWDDHAPIFESVVTEQLAVAMPTDGCDYAIAFADAAERTPEMATDLDTLRAWFAIAVMAGYAAGASAASTLTRQEPA